MVSIHILDDNNQEIAVVQQEAGEKIASALRRGNVPYQFPCDGKGNCGKCKFQRISGDMTSTVEEQRLLPEWERNMGVGLLCQTTCYDDAWIRIDHMGEETIDSAPIQPDVETMEPLISVEAIDYGTMHREEFDYKSLVLAVDLGTTTIALALWDVNLHRVLGDITVNNSQRFHGADVLSRIQAANHGLLLQMQEMAWRDILQGMCLLLQRCLTQEDQHYRIPGKIVVAGNTTMQHILFGDSCQGLGRAPFRPVSLELRRRSLGDVFPGVPGEYREMEVVSLPGISTFVGADILAGMCALDFGKQSQPVLLLDLGTNGEMVLWDGEHCYATATAAGPAFEAGNITCGMPGIAGAICGISIVGGRVITQTIRGKEARGLCGTGVLEAIYELYRQGLLDEDGTFLEEYRKTGCVIEIRRDGKEIIVNQEDVRQFQLAKAAIQSGIRILLREAGIPLTAVEQVYLAGGLGYQMNVHKAVGVGLLPREWEPVTKAVGNTSMQGVLRFIDEGDEEGLYALRAKTKEMNLANHPLFEKYFYQSMKLGSYSRM